MKGRRRLFKLFCSKKKKTWQEINVSTKKIL
jgi:hypothetical protein